MGPVRKVADTVDVPMMDAPVAVYLLLLIHPPIDSCGRHVVRHRRLVISADRLAQAATLSWHKPKFSG